MGRPRHLVVVADDFGMGPETSRAILDLAADGLVTATVLLVNSPYAERTVAAWNKAGRPVELGWHPALTIDRPVLPPERVPSLVDGRGYFWTLGKFLRRALLGRLNPHEVATELAAQYERFRDLAGAPPALVNSHQHVSLFPPVTRALHELLSRQPDRPFVRRVREPRWLLARIPGARVKRTVLDALGRRQARDLERAGFPGCDWLAGITDPPFVDDPRFHTRWLARLPGQTVELACHPGYHDLTLIGRDCSGDDEWLRRRVREVELFRRPEYAEAVRAAGFELMPAGKLTAAQRAA
jgi:chitin disaccharide deacetylase